MTVNSLYPDWIKLFYTSNGRQKTALLPCIIDGSASPGVQPDLTVRVGASVPSTTCVTNYVNVIKPFFNTSDTFDKYEIYHKATLTSAPLFVYTAPLAIAGSSSSPDVDYVETVISFKTPLAGNLKIYLMEGINPADVKLAFPSTSDAKSVALAAFVLGASDWIVGRNNSFPLAGINLTTKQNDFYRRKYKL